MGQVSIDEVRLAKLSAAAQHDATIIEKEREVTELKGIWEAAKDASLSAKKNYDKAVNELRAVIAEGPSPQMGLFDAGTSAAVAVQPESVGLRIAEHSSPVASWKDETIDVLNVSAAIKGDLQKIGVMNLGQAQNLRMGRVAGYEEGAAAIAGWTATKVKRFEAAMVAVIPDQTDDVPEDEVDTVEAIDSAAEPEPDAPADPGSVRIRIIGDVQGMTEHGLVAGAEFDAVESDGMTTIMVEGTTYALDRSEFEFVAREVAEAV